MPFKNTNRVVSVGRRIRSESGRLDCFKGDQSNKRFILDNENAHQLMLFAHPDITTQAG